jgi:hypothetical protein
MAKGERRIEWVFGSALAALLVAASARAAADEVNVARGLAQDGPGLRAQLNADAGWTTGNVDILQLKGGGSLGYETGPHNMLVSLSGGYAETMGTNVARQWAMHGHYRHRLLENLAVEGYANHLYDKFAGLDSRFSAGPNIVFLFGVDALRVDLGVGYMIQYEDYGPVTGLKNDYELDWAGRAHFYVFFKYAIVGNLELLEHAFYMPRLDWPGPRRDYMIVSATSLAFHLNQTLSYQNSFNVSFDHPAPINTKALNTELMAGLALKF